MPTHGDEPPSLTSDEPPADSGTEAHLHSRPGLTEVPRRNPSLPSDGTRRGFVRPSPLFGHLGPLTGTNTSAPTSPAGECLRRESERGLGWRRRHDIKARACHPGHRPRIATTRGSVLSLPPHRVRRSGLPLHRSEGPRASPDTTGFGVPRGSRRHLWWCISSCLRPYS